MTGDGSFRCSARATEYRGNRVDIAIAISQLSSSEQTLEQIIKVLGVGRIYRSSRNKELELKILSLNSINSFINLFENTSFH